jgi:hypothetical protein
MVDNIEVSNHSDLFPLSKSKLSAFDFCPLQFKKRYIDKIKQESQFQLVVGVKVHELFDSFFDYCDELSVDQWATLVDELDDCSPFEKGMVSWFIEMEQYRKKLYTNVQYEPLIREVDLYNTDLNIHGIADRVDVIDPNLVPYMKGEISTRSINKIKQQLADGKKLLCIIEYKTGNSFYIQGLKKEISFYKKCIEGSGLYKDYILACGCVINPRLRRIEYMDFEMDKTVETRIRNIAWNIQNNQFIQDCSYAKYNACGLCDLVEAGLSEEYERP